MLITMGKAVVFALCAMFCFSSCGDKHVGYITTAPGGAAVTIKNVTSGEYKDFPQGTGERVAVNVHSVVDVNSNGEIVDVNSSLTVDKPIDVTASVGDVLQITYSPMKHFAQEHASKVFMTVTKPDGTEETMAADRTFVFTVTSELSPGFYSFIIEGNCNDGDCSLKETSTLYVAVK